MFELAKPIFIEDIKEEGQVSAFFAANFECDGENAEIKITGSAKYKVTVNGSFAGHGPQACEGYYAYEDVWDIGKLVSWGLNQVVIEAVHQGEGGFILAEIHADGKLVAATGKNFIAFIDMERCFPKEGVEESYVRTGCCMAPAKVLETVPQAIPVPRKLPYPEYNEVRPVKDVCAEVGEESVTIDLKGRFYGFLQTVLSAEEKAELSMVLHTSKNPSEGKSIEFVLQKGEYEHETFEAYSFRYVTFRATKGRARLLDISVREVK